MIPVIPKEIDADIAMSTIKSCIENITGNVPVCTYEFEGVSERTALGDEIRVSIKNRGNKKRINFYLKRDSLYHILPEYLFHPLDRYLGIEDDSEEFYKQYKLQEEQKKNALIYFKPFDSLHQDLKISYQQWLSENVLNSKFIADYILQDYQYNKDNPFIISVLPCLNWIRNYRGNKEMVITALNYAFRGNVKIDLIYEEIKTNITDNIHYRLNGTLEDLYCGETFVIAQNKWYVSYQTEIKSYKELKILNQYITEFKIFFQEWFLSLDSILELRFGDWNAIPILTDNFTCEGIFLNYSTQLI